MTKRKTWICLVVLLVLPVIVTAQNGMTLITIGTDGGITKDDETPVASILGVSGTAGHRRSLGASQYLDVSTALSVDVIDFSEVSDREFMEILWGMRYPRGRVEAEASLLAALSGDQDGSPFVAPSWSGEYRWETAPLMPRVGYHGSFRSESEGSEDFSAQSLIMGITHEPDIRTALDVSVDVGWVLWPETPLVDSGGAETNETRNDLVVGATAAASRLMGYYADHETGVRGEWLKSNANRWVGSLESSSEDRLSAQWFTKVNWSPRASVDIGIGVTVAGSIYTQRAALDKTGSPLSKDLKVMTAAASLRADWTPDQRTHVVLSGTYSQTIANQSDTEGSNLEARVGVEVGLQPGSR